MVILWKMCYEDVLASCFLILKCLSAIRNAGKYNFAIGCVSKNVACVAVDEEHCTVDCLGNVLWQFIRDVINTFCCTSALIGHKHFIRLDIFLQREISCLYSGTVPVLVKQRRPGIQTKTKTLIKKHQANGNLEACKSRSNRSC